MAALGYAIHRYGADWPDSVKQAVRVAVEEATWGDPVYLTNGSIGIAAGRLLAAEALDLGELWQQGMQNLRQMVDRVMHGGGIEMASPLYTAHHIAPLVFMLALRDERANAWARTLLEYELLVQAHLYLPGGGLMGSAPGQRTHMLGRA